MSTNGTPLIEGRGIAKHFGRIEALRNVSFSLGEAQVLSLAHAYEQSTGWRNERPH